MKQTIGFAMCGSFCTFERALDAMSGLAADYDILPVLSGNAATLDTRFGRAEDFVRRVREISGREPITGIVDAEPIGPRGICSLMLVAPCTGNTLAKLRAGVTDTAVTMAVKSHLRGGGRVLIALSTNDALCAGAENLGALAARGGYFFVPLVQDAPDAKPFSLVADYSRLREAVEAALEGRQLRPALY